MRIFIFAACAALAACTSAKDLQDPTADLGNFLLGHNVVIASKAKKGPLSRDASEEELTTALKGAIDERFGRYDGTNYFHLGVSVEGYNLALPGIPIVAAPKSVLLVNVTVWDDAKNKKMTEKPEQLTVFESFSGDSIVGSGLTKSKEEQMKNLAQNAAKQIEIYLQKNRDWFGDAPAPTSKAGGSKVAPVATEEPVPPASEITPPAAAPATSG
ncbi:MAG: hypothetical protein ACRBBU_15830 [Pseudooceanicola sp.]